MSGHSSPDEALARLKQGLAMSTLMLEEELVSTVRSLIASPSSRPVTTTQWILASGETLDFSQRTEASGSIQVRLSKPT
jgi:hypothetical protein